MKALKIWKDPKKIEKIDKVERSALPSLTCGMSQLGYISYPVPKIPSHQKVLNSIVIGQINALNNNAQSIWDRATTTPH
jgi:hypothetical protein